MRTALLLRPRRNVLRAMPNDWQMLSSPDSSAGLNRTSTVCVRVFGLRLTVFLLGGAGYEGCCWNSGRQQLAGNCRGVKSRSFTAAGVVAMTGRPVQAKCDASRRVVGVGE